MKLVPLILRKVPVKENGIHIFTIQADGDWTIEVNNLKSSPYVFDKGAF